MKKILLFFLLSVLAVGFLYAAFAVGNWEYNIGKWAELGRVLFAAYSFLAVVFINLSPHINK